MTDVWDIANYVEAHPDNYRQRWRLAKKLYMSWEYRLALEHLQVLKNEWDPKASVIRYLAATYYRLGRYDEAIRELRAALNQWPGEIGIYEQLARTLAVADKKYEAVDIWEEVAEIDPDHPYAKRAIKHLRKQIEIEEGDQRGSTDDERETTGENPNEVACPNCGQVNSTEFRRCWQCHSPLFDDTQLPDSDDRSDRKTRQGLQALPWGLIGGLTIASLLALGVFVTLRGWGAAADAGLDTRIPTSVQEYFLVTLPGTRVVLGAVLLIAWPILWRLAALAADADNEVYDATMYQLGLILALLAYALSWLPGFGLLAALVVPLLLSALIAFLGLQLVPVTAAKLWGLQAAGALVIAFAIVAGRHGTGLIAELPAIVAFAGAETEANIQSADLAAPETMEIGWASSGSDWLDTHANAATIEVMLERPLQSAFIELTLADETLAFEQIREGSHRLTLEGVQTGVTYVLGVRVREREPVRAVVRVEGVFPVALTPTGRKPSDDPPAT